MTASDAFNIKVRASVVFNVTPRPASGPPGVNITRPAPGAVLDSKVNNRLASTLSDRCGGTGARYVVTSQCLRPADYGFTDDGVRLSTVSLSVTDPERLTATDQVQVQIGFVP